MAIRRERRSGIDLVALVGPALLAVCGAVSAGRGDPARHVDPFIGTGGHGHTYPGASVPFGMVQLSPDTRLTGWDGCSGYHFSDDVVYGFSHTHLSGTGVDLNQISTRRKAETAAIATRGLPGPALERTVERARLGIAE